MLTYHPAFDFYHTAFRLLLIIEKMGLGDIEIERARIWDFYFVFPREIKSVSFPRTLWDLRPDIKYPNNDYEDLRNSQITFERMKPYQLAALKYLASYGFLNSEMLSGGIIQRTKKKIPAKLHARMVDLNEQQEVVIALMGGPFNDLPLHGDRGLKFRTKLIDFKYDPT